ncbi:sugar kinase [Subtercola boreus]|uniref:Sugar kinase n=1 Tax=Subtercola boreus TaxID=120213 RepID=A0A3E0VLF7_9MICO|nr:sugar kinase [Subtercola boreus]RFA10802.1 sugar kinase [Subtercola boreus]TQL55623.1 2-dehydro-3-deoxygluconokinase [Subtercola boreus]
MSAGGAGGADGTDGTAAASAPRVVTFGETMALFVSATPAPLAHVDSLALRIGGAESNVAIALHRLGTAVTWVGRVGDDSLGELIARELRAEGFDSRALVNPGRQTGLMVKEKRTAESTRVSYYRSGSAGSTLAPEDLGDTGIASASLLHVTGITPALSASASAATEHAIALAAASGVAVSFDVNHRPSLWADRDPAALYRSIAARSQLVFAGEDEARLLVPDARTPAELAAGIAALGPRHVVIKLGADGAYALVGGVAYSESAVPVVVVDTVGAGDGFVAGYLSEYLAGHGAPTCLKTAVTVGAFACLAAGDWEGLPKRHELSLLHATEPVTR